MIYVTVNSKGGVGKTTISTQVLPLKQKDIEDISIYEIDNNNISKLKNSNINFKNFNIRSTEDALNEVIFNTLLDNKKLNIIDSGGGDDTKNVIKKLKELRIQEQETINFVIPCSNDIAANKNLIDTIQLIKNNIENRKIILALNNVYNLQNYRQEFINLFGYEQYSIKGIFKEIEKDVDNIMLIPFNNYFNIVKNVYLTTLKDLEEETEKVTKNLQQIRLNLAKQGKEVFLKQIKKINFLVDLNKFIKNIKNNIKEL